ncbi:MAG: glutamate-1-semialdehyde 2,1-aminomutase [Nitrospinota bacterium]|nr:glutamate-1-semialdehyde 2,1-aminomutase [Nitrospinota bacterium]
MRKELSEKYFSLAQKRIPGGVDSPVRAFKGVGGTPFFVERGKGSRVWDVDGNEYIDYVLSWGPLILGHAHPRVVSSLKDTIESGTSFGAPTVLETTLAELVQDSFPSMELIRFVNSGTEATMSSIRLARGFTGRNAIVKFDGCYHGHSDGLLVKTGSGGATFGVPDSEGVPKDYARNTFSLPFNDINVVEELFFSHGEKISCIIVEPVAGNMGLIVPDKEYLEALRSLSSKYGCLLIFDEVMTGFRVAKGGAQQLFEIEPDLTTLGKVIGGGLPVAAYGGKKEIMEKIAPLGAVYQAGTLSGNPLAMAAGIETIKVMNELDLPGILSSKVEYLVNGLLDLSKINNIPLTASCCGSMFGFYFQEDTVKNFSEALRSDLKLYSCFFHGMLQEGVAFAPSQFEVGFMSVTHEKSDLDFTLEAASKVLKKIR